MAGVRATHCTTTNKPKPGPKHRTRTAHHSAPGHENLTHLPKTSWSAKGQTRFCVEKKKMIEFQPRLLPAALTTY